jgi:hypothetical protein
MFNPVVAIAAHVLSWMFVIGMAGCVVLVFPLPLFNCLACCSRKTIRMN